MNNVILTGRLVRDPVVNFYESKSIKVCKIVLAVDRSYSKNTSEKKADFINVTYFGRLAEICEKFLSKGSLITVNGKIQTNTYEDSNGIKKYSIDIIGSELEMISTRKSSSAV